MSSEPPATGGGPGATGPGPEPGPPPDAAVLARLSEVLGRVRGGASPTATELAEVLWLARRTGPREADAPSDEGLPAVAAPDPARPAAPTVPEPVAPPPAPEAPSGPAPRVPLHLPGGRDAADRAGQDGGTRTPGAALLAPAPPMLSRPLALQRALRPLKRRVPSPLGRELDEPATADLIARLGARPEWWLPVLRPASERWLRLRLVEDTGPTMPVWRPLVRELRTVLAQSGVFRTVQSARAHPDGTVGGPPGAPQAAPDGRTVTLVISDCMGPQWWQGPAAERWYGALRRWAARMPLAVLQPLPERLWRTTALPASAGLLTPPGPAAPTAALGFTPYDPAAEEPAPGTIALPVLEPSPDWVGNWSALLADAGGGRLPGAVAWLPRRTPPVPGDAPDRDDVTRLTAADLVGRFRATASPEAFRLAGHLALGLPHLPVMRLVHAALEARPRPQHLAEVILSGMLTSVTGPPGSYAFRPGVRDLLLRSVPRGTRERTSALLARVGGLIDDRAGTAPGAFRAVVPGAVGTDATAGGGPFATVSAESVRQLLAAPERRPSGEAPPGLPVLGGRYRPVRRLAPQGMTWQALDERLDRLVAVRMWRPGGGPARLESTAAAARAVQGVSHRNVVRLDDFGFEGDLFYAVFEYVDGIGLDTLSSASSYRLPTSLLVSIASQLAYALEAVHAVGAVHGTLEARSVVLMPDGTARLGLFGLRSEADPATRSQDLRAFGKLLLHLVAGVSFDTLPTLPPPERLTALPPGLRPVFAEAVEALLSFDDARQRRALHTLRGVRAERPEPRRYTLLGPLRVRREGRTLAVGSPQESALLCALLLRHGRTVSREELVEKIWGERPPGDARVVLGTYASRLRNALGPGTLATHSLGYALHVSADDVDVIRCEELVRRAEDLHADGHLLEARAEITTALGLWRGTPLDGVPGPGARDARTRLDGLRLDLERTRAELDLELGRYAGVARATAALMGEHPLREDFLGLHMRALDRQGRTAEALAAYDAFRDRGGRAGAELDRLRSRLVEAVPRPPAAATTATATATVFELPDGTYLRADSPAARSATLRERHGWRRHELDLGERRTSLMMHLPSADTAGAFVCRVEVVWRVADPIAVASHAPRVTEWLENQLRLVARPVTSRFPSGSAEAAGRALSEALDDWRGPGIEARCVVTLSGRATATGRDALARALGASGPVLLGFDGPVTSLYTDAAAELAARQLVALATELRDPAEALDGSPFLDRLGPRSTGRIEPVTVLRAFADSRAAAGLRGRLDLIETEALAAAAPAAGLDEVLRTLARLGRRVAVVSDNSPDAMAAFLRRHGMLGLLAGGVHGRAEVPGRLTPEPDCLERALAALGATAAGSVMVGSLTTELAAAQAIGLPFVGCHTNRTRRRRLKEAGAVVTVRSTSELLDGLRALGGS